jgi:hypothetical protein
VTVQDLRLTNQRLWLEILAEANISPRSATEPLWKEADELVRILVRSRETARANRQSAVGNANRHSQITNRQKITNR